MKLLILFAVVALLGSIHCDEECFRAVFKECIREPVPKERMVLCDEMKYGIECLARFADKCGMGFSIEAEELKIAVDSVCNGGSIQKLFNEEKTCYKKAVNEDNKCYEPIREASRTRQLVNEEIIKSNKRVCKVFDSYSDCVESSVSKECGSTSMILFNSLYNPIHNLGDAICEQLILPADEKDSRTDNFGMLNPYALVASVFLYA